MVRILNDVEGSELVQLRGGQSQTLFLLDALAGGPMIARDKQQTAASLRGRLFEATDE